MKLINVRIRNYKSILDSEEFEIDQVTCLVGKNESGKTVALESLYKLNPVDNSQKYNDLFDYPRLNYVQHRKEGTIDNFIWTKWKLEEKEINELKTIFDPKSFSKDEVLVTKNFNNELNFEFVIDEAKNVLYYINEKSSLYSEEKDKLGNLKTLDEVKSILSKNTNKSEREIAFLNYLNQTFPSGFKTKIHTFFLGKLPKFLYFSQYQKLSGKISFTTFNLRKTQNQLTFEDKLFIAFLALADTTPEEIQKSGRYEELKSKLETISADLSDQVFEYWSQNENLEVEFDFRQALKDDLSPYNEGLIFHIRIKNSLYNVTVSFDERSTGFIWFFSFLVWFSNIKQTYGDNIIILLDEPGLSLHAKAQEDLLRYIKDKLAPKYQVIYTTHSPFMINPEELLQVRIVMDKSTKRNVIGTKIVNDILKTDKDTLFPLQAALGYDITQTLFIGKNTLLVEGPSDLLYLTFFSKELENRKRTYLDTRVWTICPVGGVDKISSFMSLFGGNKLNIVVLTDFHDPIKNKILNLEKRDLLKVGRVLIANNYTKNASEADIEDIMTREFYIELINNTYDFNDSPKLTEKKPNNAPGRVTIEVEDFFKNNNVLQNYNHYDPALYLVKNVEKYQKSNYIEEALNNFEKLFKEINTFLETENP